MLGNDTEMLRFLVDMSREINPHGTVTPVAGKTQAQSLAAEIEKLETEMHDTKARSGPDSYWNSPAKQARYRELIEIDEKMNAG